MIQCQNNFNQSINKAKVEMSQLLSPMIDRNEKLYLTHFQPFLIFLAILTKNYDVFDTLTKIQFHHNIFKLINPKSLTKWQVFTSRNWTWLWMWAWSPTLWFSFNFRICVDFGILTQFGPNSRADIDSYTIDLEIEPSILDTHIPLMDHECELQFFDLEPTFEPKLTLKPKLDLSHIPESVLIFEPFILESKLTIPPSHILLLDQDIAHNDSEMIF